MAADDVRQRSLDPADPYLREAQTFPELSPEQIERITPFGTLETLSGDGAVLAVRDTAPGHLCRG